MFEIKLSAEKSFLDNLVLNETVDIDLLDKIINSDLLLTNNWDDHIYENEKEQLTNYRRLIKKNNAVVKYQRVKNMPYGRCNPQKGLGLFLIRRAIRQTLTKNNYVDIDIINCHPEILLQICKYNNINCDYLSDYVNNRSQHLNDVMEQYKVNKDDAKKLFISLLYFGSFESWAKELLIDDKPNLFITNFKRELKEIGQIIYDKNDEIKNAVKKRKEEQNKKNYNNIGSVVSYFLQEVECRILETIYLYCIKNNYIINNNCILCADGLMLEKKYFKDQLLETFNKLIKDKFKLDLKFIVKEMVDDIKDVDAHTTIKENKNELCDNYELINIDEEKDFEIIKLKMIFNQDVQIIEKEKFIKNFHLTNTFKYMNHYFKYFYLSNTYYKIYKNKIEPCSNFEKMFNEFYIVLEKPIKLTKIFDTCQHKKSFSTFDFEPNRKEENDKYNLFQGFIFDSPDNTYDLEIIKPFLDHVEFICSNNGDKSKECEEYLLNWFSHIIQKPETKTKVAIVLFSIVEGVGKNILIDIFKNIVDGYSSTIRDTNALTDRFNAEHMGKLFTEANEINAKAQEIANELKDIIVRENENMEFKGKDKINIKDYKNYMMTTNNENVFKVSNSDRRFMFIELPEEKKSIEYYKLLFKLKDNKTFLKNLYNYFKCRVISNYEPSKIIMTEYKKRCIYQNLPAYIKFIVDEFEIRQGINYSPEELYNYSILYAKNNRLNSSYSEMLFFKQFKKVFGKFNFKDEKNRRSLYKFDDLDEIKKQIDKHYINNEI